MAATDRHYDRHRTEAVIEDVLFMVVQGEHPERIAKRLGISLSYVREILRAKARQHGGR